MSIIRLVTKEAEYADNDVAYDYEEFNKLVSFFTKYEEYMMDKENIEGSYYVSVIGEDELIVSTELINYIIKEYQDNITEMADLYNEMYELSNFDSYEDFVKYIIENKKVIYSNNKHNDFHFIIE